MRSLTVPIVTIDRVTPRSRLLAVDLGHEAFPFRAGQAVLLGATGQSQRRPYSIACSPERAAEIQRLEILIAVESDGSFGPHLPGVQPGTNVDVEGPVGTFTLPISSRLEHLLFVAGGTGIAPLRAMIDHELRHDSASRMSLLYSARQGDEFAFIEELREHARAGRLELHDTVTRDAKWAGPRGRIARAHFEAVLHEPATTLCFVCGPPQLVADSVSTLTALGVPLDLIRTEQWGN